MGLGSWSAIYYLWDVSFVYQAYINFEHDEFSFKSALTKAEAIFFAVYGPLQGKYIYFKLIFISELFLKKCSSVLGYSYVTTQVAEMLIADNLDVNVLLAPKDAIEVFKKGSKTYCRGLGVYM